MAERFRADLGSFLMNCVSLAIAAERGPMAPKFPAALLGRAVMRVCRVSSWRFDSGCQLLDSGTATTTDKLIGSASPTSSHLIPQGLQVNGIALVPPKRLEDSMSCRFLVKHAN